MRWGSLGVLIVSFLARSPRSALRARSARRRRSRGSGYRLHRPNARPSATLGRSRRAVVLLATRTIRCSTPSRLALIPVPTTLRRLPEPAGLGVPLGRAKLSASRRGLRAVLGVQPAHAAELQLLLADAGVEPEGDGARRGVRRRVLLRLRLAAKRAGRRGRHALPLERIALRRFEAALRVAPRPASRSRTSAGTSWRGPRPGPLLPDRDALARQPGRPQPLHGLGWHGPPTSTVRRSSASSRAPTRSSR